MRKPLWLILIAFATCLSGCPEEASEEKPSGPNMAPLVASYANPDLPLTQETAQAVIDELSQVVVETGAFCGWSEIEDLLCEGADCLNCSGLDALLEAVGSLENDDESIETHSDGLVFRQQALEVGSQEVEGDGFFRITQTCRGWDSTSQSPDPANGEFKLIVGFSDDGVDSVIFGDFSQCKMLVNEEQALLDGTIGIYVGDTFTVESRSQTDLLVEFEGSLQLNDQALEGSFDFKVLSAGGLELRVQVVDENIVLKAADSRLSLRAANGEWNCSFQEQQCTNDSGGVVSWSL